MACKSNKHFLAAFADQTVIHGIAYVFGSASCRIIERLIWFCVVVGATIFGAVLTYQLYYDWQGSPVTITINSVTRSLASTRFPAVTVCKSGASITDNLKGLLFSKYGKPQNDENFENFDEITSELVGWNSSSEATLPDFVSFMYYDIGTLVDVEILKGVDNPSKNLPYDLFVNPTKEALLNETRVKLTDQISEKFNFVEDMLSDPNNTQLLYNILWRTLADSCDTLIKRCELQGQPKRCSELFMLLPTISGPCCTFNANNGMYRDSAFNSAVETLRRDNPDTDWGDLNAAPGMVGGLSILLDLQTYGISSGTILSNNIGVAVSVYNQDQYPNQDLKQIIVTPGQESFIQLNKIAINVEDSVLSSLNAKQRECYHHNEYELEMYSQYTYAFCIDECLLKAAYALHNCSLWNMPSMQNRICHPRYTADFAKFMTFVDRGKACKHCLPDCTSTILSSKFSSAPFRKCDGKNVGISDFCKLTLKIDGVPNLWGDVVARDYELNNVSINTGKKPFVLSELRQLQPDYVFKKALPARDYHAYQDDVALVHIFFDSPTIIEYQKKATMTGISFVSQVGGILGLCLGISVVSFFELFYWIVFRGVGRLLSN